MIYQNIKDGILNQEENIKEKLQDLILNTEFPLSTKVEDLISLYIEFSQNEKNSQHLIDGFHLLFEKNLINWHSFKDFESYTNTSRTTKKRIEDLNIFNLPKLIEKPFHDYFLSELKNKSFGLRKLSNQAVASNITTSEELETIWNLFNLQESSKFRNDFLISVKSYKQMEQICKFSQLTPWTLVQKENGIETFWATNIWQLENAFALRTKSRSSYEYRESLFLKDKDIWKQISSHNTDIIDLESRIVFSAANMKNEHAFNSLLNLLDIKKINLDCMDYIVSPNKQISLKERLFQQGKIKTINKFEKTKEVSTDITKLVTSLPAKAELISNKKGFLKQWLKTKDKIDNYESILISVLDSRFKKYTDSSFDIKCFFPIKPDFIEKPESFWLENKYNQVNYFLKFQEYNTDVSFDSFVNLLTWLNTKNINWEQPYKNNTLLGETIVSCMQFKYARSLDLFGKEDNFILNKFKNSNENLKINVLENIKYSWHNIWTKDQEKEHDNYVLNSPFKRDSVCINLFSNIVKDIAKNNIKVPVSFFDEHWYNIKDIIQKYSIENQSSKDFLIAASFIEVNSKLNTTENIKTKKINKI